MPLGTYSESGLVGTSSGILVSNYTDFKACVNLLQGSDVVVFRTYKSHYVGDGRYGVTLPVVTVYFFPYQGFLIAYYEPQE